MNIFQSIKPGVPRRMLLFVAAVVWTLAGGMLLFKGMKLVLSNGNHLCYVLSGSAVTGSLFYLLLFSKISLKHTRRIINLDHEYPCFFSFFNLKSYILMSSMISLGIILRLSGLIPSIYLSVLYLTMGIPLFLSAFRFYYYGIFYRSALSMKL